jgi:hypothetical protein
MLEKPKNTLKNTLRQGKMTFHHHWREDAVTAMGGGARNARMQMKKPTLRESHNTDNVSGPPPNIQLLRHAQQTTNTTFWDHHPDVPLLMLELRCLMTQPPAAQAAQGKPSTDHGCQSGADALA